MTEPRDEDNLPVGDLIKALADPEAREAITKADMIFGVDTKDPTHRALFFGRATLERIACSGREQDLEVLEIPVDWETDDPEALAAACLEIKGSCCYRSYRAPSDQRDRINPQFN